MRHVILKPRANPFSGRLASYVALSVLTLALVLAPWEQLSSPTTIPKPRQVGANDSQSEPTPRLSRFEFSQVHMGTLFRIVLYAADHITAERASGAAFKRIADLDHIMSDYDPASELMQLCRSAGGPPVHLSNDLFRVMTASQDLARRSDGAFDITVGPVVRLWRRARRRHELPDPERLAPARALVGYQLLRIDVTAHTAMLLKPGMLLDLGGIAKGDAADQALLVLRRYGIANALVAAAGDIAIGAAPPHPWRGNHQQAPGWKIAIAPLEPRRNATGKSNTAKLQSQLIYLHDCAISTSGDSEQHVELGGVRYSHIVNPKTGMALTGRRSVTVIAPRGIAADSLATAVCVLGPERGLALIKNTPAAGVFHAEERANRVDSFRWNFPRSTADKNSAPR